MAETETLALEKERKSENTSKKRTPREAERGGHWVLRRQEGEGQEETKRNEIVPNGTTTGTVFAQRDP